MHWTSTVARVRILGNCVCRWPGRLGAGEQHVRLAAAMSRGPAGTRAFRMSAPLSAVPCPFFTFVPEHQQER